MEICPRFHKTEGVQCVLLLKDIHGCQLSFMKAMIFGANYKKKKRLQDGQSKFKGSLKANSSFMD